MAGKPDLDRIICRGYEVIPHDPGQRYSIRKPCLDQFLVRKPVLTSQGAYFSSDNSSWCLIQNRGRLVKVRTSLYPIRGSTYTNKSLSYYFHLDLLVKLFPSSYPYGNAANQLTQYSSKGFIDLYSVKTTRIGKRPGSEPDPDPIPPISSPHSNPKVDTQSLVYPLLFRLVRRKDSNMDTLGCLRFRRLLLIIAW